MPNGRAAVDARREAWQASLDPRVLWPEVGREAFDGAMLAIVETVRSVLTRPEMTALMVVPPSLQVGVGPAAYVAGMGGLLGYWIERGSVSTAPALQAELAEHLRHGRRRYHRLAQRVGGLLDELDRRQVSVTVLKGMHTGPRYFPEPGARPLSDVDLLVDPHHVAEAAGGLRACGFDEVETSRRPFRSVWEDQRDVAPIPSLDVDHWANPWSVDLHVMLGRRYARGVAAVLTTNRPRQAVPFALGARAAAGLGQPLLTAFLALHASYAIHQLRLVRLVELVLVIRTDAATGALRWDALDTLLRQSALSRFCYPAFELVEHLAPGTVDPMVRRTVVSAASPRLRRVVQTIIAEGTLRLPHRSLEEKLMWAASPLELAGTVSEFVWPSDSRLRWTDRIRLWRQFGSQMLQGHIGLRARGGDPPARSR